MEEGGDGDGDGEPHPPSSDGPSLSDKQPEFIPLDSVDLDGDSEKGSGLHEESHDPWARISELPPSLGEKMAQLKTEKLVYL